MKKITSYVLTVMMIFCLTAFPTFASSGANPGYAPEENFIVNRSVISNGPIGGPLNSEVITAADVQANIERRKAFSKDNSLIQPAAVTWIYIPTSSYPIYAQENSYYCAPAAVRTMLNFFNGSAPSQATIASKIKTTTSGTYINNVLPYLEPMSGFPYLRFSGNQSDMRNSLYETIAGWEVPALIGCRYTKGGPWRYSTSQTGGHYLTVYGVTTDESQFMLSDSWIKYAGIAGESYTAVTASQLYTAYTSAGIGLLW